MPREGRDRDRSKRAKLGMPGMMMQMQPHMMAPQMMPMMRQGNMMMPHHQMAQMGVPQHQQQMVMAPSSSDDEEDHGEPVASSGVEAKAAPAQTPAAPPALGSHEQQSAEVAKHMQAFPSEAMKQRISRSCSYVRQLPRWMLQETLEFLNQNFDATLVADLTVNGLLALVFLFTRIRPNVRVSELRAWA